MSGTIRQKCECKNEYQDKQYGTGIRIMNKMTKTDGYRCTSCGKEKSSSTRHK